MRGVAVWVARPDFRRSCRSCEAYLYAPDGSLERDSQGNPEPRARGTPTPCLSCPKVPRWAKASGRDWDECRAVADELSDASRAALRFYFRCKATGIFPADPIVAWYSGIVREAEDADHAARLDRSYEAIAALLSVLAAKGGFPR